MPDFIMAMAYKPPKTFTMEDFDRIQKEELKKYEAAKVECAKMSATQGVVYVGAMYVPPPPHCHMDKQDFGPPHGPPTHPPPLTAPPNFTPVGAPMGPPPAPIPHPCLYKVTGKKDKKVKLGGQVPSLIDEETTMQPLGCCKNAAPVGKPNSKFKIDEASEKVLIKGTKTAFQGCKATICGDAPGTSTIAPGAGIVTKVIIGKGSGAPTKLEKQEIKIEEKKPRPFLPQGLDGWNKLLFQLDLISIIGGWSKDAASYVCQAAGIDPGKVLDYIGIVLNVVSLNPLPLIELAVGSPLGGPNKTEAAQSQTQGITVIAVITVSPNPVDDPEKPGQYLIDPAQSPTWNYSFDAPQRSRNAASYKWKYREFSQSNPSGTNRDDQTQGVISIDFQWGLPGNHVIQLEATDGSLAQKHTASKTFKIVSRPPEVQLSVSNMSPKRGESITLTPTITNHIQVGEQQIRWSKTTGATLQIDKGYGFESFFSHSIDSFSNGAITIRNTYKAGQATIECKAKNRHGEGSNSVQIDFVAVTPTITINATVSSQSGNQATIQVQLDIQGGVTGDMYTPNIKVYKDNTFYKGLISGQITLTSANGSKTLTDTVYKSAYAPSGTMNISYKVNIYGGDISYQSQLFTECTVPVTF